MNPEDEAAAVDVKDVNDEKRNKRTTREMKKKDDNDVKKANTKRSWFGWKSAKAGKDIEADKPAQRPTKLFAPIYNGLSAGLCLCTSLLSYYYLSDNLV